MKLFKFVTYTTLFIFLLSCKHTTEYFEIDDSPEVIDFSNFHFKYFDFDSVHIISNEDFYLNKMSVKEIIVYEQLNDTIALCCKVSPTYVLIDSVYKINFDIPIKGTAPVVNYNIYFNLLDDEYVQVDTTITYFTPLTADATFEFALRDIPNWVPIDREYFEYLNEIYWDVDAFDISENSNYWVFRVRDYFFGWDRNNNSVQYYDVHKEYPSNIISSVNKPHSPWGRDVVYYNNALYFDIYGDVRKMNYNDSTYTYFFSYDKYSDFIGGYENDYFPERLAVDSAHIYIQTERNWIIVIGHDGNFVEIFNWEGDYYGDSHDYLDIEVYKNILYGYMRNSHELARYNLTFGDILSSIPAPANYGYGGFNILFDRVYYIDWEDGNETMVSVPLSSIINE